MTHNSQVSLFCNLMSNKGSRRTLAIHKFLRALGLSSSSSTSKRTTSHTEAWDCKDKATQLRASALG
jgi:hypothetical protein